MSAYDVALALWRRPREGVRNASVTWEKVLSTIYILRGEAISGGTRLEG
jgi:hypothetical protein